MKTLLLTIFLVIAHHSYGKPSDTLPPDPCPPLTGELIVKVYPIPTTGQLTVDIGSCDEINNTVLFLDSAGRNVAKFFGHQSVMRFNISNLPRGVYFIRVINERRVVNKKAMIY